MSSHDGAPLAVSRICYCEGAPATLRASIALGVLPTLAAHFFQSKTPFAASYCLRHSLEDVMNTATLRRSLAQLRAKTNRELGILAHRQIDRALYLASRAHYQDAERGFTAAVELMTVVELTSAERVRLENRLAELSAILEQRTGVAAGARVTFFKGAGLRAPVGGGGGGFVRGKCPPII